MRAELLAHPWICSGCAANVQALMAVVYQDGNRMKRTYCFRCWKRYVASEFGFPEVRSWVRDLADLIPTA